MTASDRIAEPWGRRTPYGRGERWPHRTDIFLEEGIGEDQIDRWAQSAAILHSNGDGLDIAVKDGRIVGVRGRVEDRVNHGRVDPKDLYGWQANNSPDRLTRPLIKQDGRLKESTWDEAMNLVVERMNLIRDEKGPLGIGFYTSGQLFLEEYYTLGVLGKAGLGTPHMDGNTRLCTATAAAALKESFGADGQPGSYSDIDHADVICLYGHNVAETQAVMWMRMLDRLAGPEPPKLVVVDPRMTQPARRADVHLAVRNGTNLALMNALLREILVNGWIDEDYIERNTIGFEELKSTVKDYPPEKAAEICGVEAADIRRAAEMIGGAERLLSTVLQGFYQSMSATASSCQVNNIHLARGMLGKPGCGVLQMNGQPTAQNTRECGADGDLPGFRNWENPRHIEELSTIWNVDPLVVSDWSPPTHASEIFRYAEQGSINMLWISATNPAVSLPDLDRIRSILSNEHLFLVVQDAFLTETAQYADAVLPAAIWGEKTGTFTNVDRTVHLSEKAVEPPGEARPDLDIFLDLAARMGFTDKDGEPLIKWSDPESAFEAWKECTRGRPCDYTGITYRKLGEGPVQWPCNDEAPDGTERMYTGGRFSTDPDYCETFGHDLMTGGSNSETEYRAMEPRGRAIFKALPYQPPYEEPHDEYRYSLTTGRVIYHFHTRTKTARAPQLNAAAPDVWVEMSEADAAELGVSEGDRVRVESERGCIEAPLRITGIRPGTVFVPFHYGYFDTLGSREPDGKPRAANELTIFEWDPVSKQPYFKFAAVKLTKVGGRLQEMPEALERTAAAHAGTRG